jgi:hypothetical protein
VLRLVAAVSVACFRLWAIGGISSFPGFSFIMGLAGGFKF